MDVESQLQLIESIVAQCQKVVREDGSLWEFLIVSLAVCLLLVFQIFFPGNPGGIFEGSADVLSYHHPLAP